MTHVPEVAHVLLVAHPTRHPVLSSCLRVEGEDVGYALHACSPANVPSSPTWDVVVVDGESFVDDGDRLRLLRQIGERPRSSSILYVCTRLPLEIELEHAAIWADDYVYPGWTDAERVRRRVQVVALAPWRRTSAIRQAAEQRGDRRLRVLPQVPPKAAESGEVASARRRRIERSSPFALLEKAHESGATHEMLADAFHEGRRVAVASVRESAARICDELFDELVQARVTLAPKVVEDIESTFRKASSPIVAARFGGADAVLEVVRWELDRLARAELDAIERHRARPAAEP